MQIRRRRQNIVRIQTYSIIHSLRSISTKALQKRVAAFTLMFLLFQLLSPFASFLNKSTAYADGLVITSPYKNYSYWKKGNLHAHSNFEYYTYLSAGNCVASGDDGSNTRSAMRNAYDALNFDFYALTGHSTDASDEHTGCTSNDNPLTWNFDQDGSESDIVWMGSAPLTGTANKYTGGSTEMKVKGTVGTGAHVGLIGISSFPTANSAQAIVNEVIDEGGLAIIHHPKTHNGQSDRDTTEELMTMDNFTGIEVFNNGALAEDDWDTMLQNGKKVWGFASDDSHDASTVGEAFIVVNTASSTAGRNEIMQEIKNGNFIATRRISDTSTAQNNYYDLNVTVSGSTITGKTVRGQKIRFVEDGVHKTTASSLIDGAITGTYTPTSTAKNVRVEVTNDANSHLAWSQPLTISSPPTAIYNNVANGQEFTTAGAGGTVAVALKATASDTNPTHKVATQVIWRKSKDANGVATTGTDSRWYDFGCKVSKYNTVYVYNKFPDTTEGCAEAASNYLNPSGWTGTNSGNTLFITQGQVDANPTLYLNAGTYEWAIQALDDNRAYSQAWTTGRTFTVTDPEADPPVISAVSSGNPGQTSATISWTTDKVSYSQVEYGITTGYGVTTAYTGVAVTSHMVTLSGLDDATTYHYRVRAKDLAGNVTTSTDYTFITDPTPDTTNPTVSLVSPTAGAEVSDYMTYQVTASDNIGISRVEFYFGGVKVSEDTNYPYSYSLNTNTKPNGSYAVYAKAYDTSNNSATTATVTVTVNNVVVDSSDPIISNVATTNITASTATVSWTTNEVASTMLEYGTSTAYEEPPSISPSLTTTHTVSLTGLSPLTNYYFLPSSTDAAGNESATSGGVFRTLATVVPVTGISLDPATANVAVAGTVYLTPTIAPTNASNKNVTWASSNRSVATVSGGNVLGVSAGTATITVTSNDGSFYDTSVVTVVSGMTQVAAPTFGVPSGQVASGTTVSFSTSTSGASVYYTTDGSTPTSSSILGNSVNISDATTIKAVAIKGGMYDSTVSVASYTLIPMGLVGAPAIVSSGGNILAKGASVHFVSSTPGASFRYTFNDYSGLSDTLGILAPEDGVITLPSDADMVEIRVIAYKSGLETSPEVKGTYYLFDITPDDTTATIVNNGIITFNGLPIGVTGVTVVGDYLVANNLAEPEGLVYWGGYDIASWDQNGDSLTSGLDITLTLPYSGTLTEAQLNGLSVQYYDEDTSSWKTAGISDMTVDRVNHTITFNTNHLSTYALFSPVAETSAITGATGTVAGTGTGTTRLLPVTGLDIANLLFNLFSVSVLLTLITVYSRRTKYAYLLN